MAGRRGGRGNKLGGVKMPEKYLRVAMPDGSVWDVPAKIIADNRAKYYAEIDPDTTYEGEFDFTMTDRYELKDWAANNMDWDEVEKYATKAADRRPMTADEFQEGWVNGEKEIIEK